MRNNFLFDQSGGGVSCQILDLRKKDGHAISLNFESEKKRLRNLA